jgi:hypothetical protein
MSNVFNNQVKIIADAIGEVVEEDVTLGKQVHRLNGREAFPTGGGNLKNGDTVHLRIPGHATVTEGKTADPDGLNDTTVAVTLRQFNTSFTLSSKERTLNLDDMKVRVRTHAAAMANKVDQLLWQLAKKVPIVTGAATASRPTTLTPFLDGVAYIKLIGGVNDDGMLKCVANPLHIASMVEAVKGLANPVSDIAKQYREGNLGQVAGLAFSSDRNAYSLSGTGGTYTGTTVINGTITVEGTTSIVCDGFTEGNTINAGDSFTIAGCYAVDPVSLEATGVLKPLVASALATATSGGNITIVITEPLYATGTSKNVSALPQDGAAVDPWLNSAVTPYGTSLVFHPNAFVMASVPMEPYPDLPSSVVTIPDLGLSLRLSSGTNISSDDTLYRIDMLVAAAMGRPNYAARVLG